MKYVKDPVHGESRLVVWAWGPWEREMLFNGCGVSAWCAEKVLDMGDGDSCTTV